MAKIRKITHSGSTNACTAITTLPCGACASSPSITSMSPASATAGNHQFILTVNGNDFRRNSAVNWNGLPVTTTFGSTHQLLAIIPCDGHRPTLTVVVSVFNPAEGSTSFFSGAIGAVSTTGCSCKASNRVPLIVSP